MNKFNSRENITKRNIGIDLLLGRKNQYVQKFNKIWNSLQVLETNVYHKSFSGELIYYHVNSPTNREWVFYHDTRHDVLWYSPERYNIYFETDFNNLEIRAITKTILESIFPLFTSVLLRADRRTSNLVTHTLDNRIDSLLYGTVY